ncbi:hypothetical protein LINPERPRIM_LOCUS14890 [Linum perenne]
MTGDRRQFSKLIEQKGGKVIFGDNNRRQIIGKGTVGNVSDPIFHNVLLVEHLKHNLLSISQLCVTKNEVIFEPTLCRVQRISDKKILCVGSRKENIYCINMKNQSAFHEHCFS